jgi:hypothetical protein
MKADKYLEKCGVKPRYNKKSLINTIVFFSGTFFHSEMMLEPDCFEWCQAANDNLEHFNERCNLMSFASSGNLKELLPLLNKLDSKELFEFMCEVLDLVVYWQLISEEDFDNFDKITDSTFWAKAFNDFLMIEDEENRWDSKAQVIRAYSIDNRWSDEAKKLVEDIAA